MTATTRVAELKLLNQKRWEAHTPNEAHTDAMEAQPTAGVLFNRPNPLYKDGDEYQKPYVRNLNHGKGGYKEMRGKLRWIDGNGRWVTDEKKLDKGTRYLEVSGYTWWNSLKPNSRRKYRIPRTSVVNKVGDLKCCFCGPRMTAAQYIWYVCNS